jgi:hypothetical protein
MAHLWMPGLPVTGATELRSIASAIAFGREDNAFNTIASLLGGRGCTTVDTFRDWTKGEFFSLLKANGQHLKMKSHRSAYLAGFEKATGVRLEAETSHSENPMKAERKATGGDMLGNSRKIVSNAFNGTKWTPDAFVYEGVPLKADVDEFMPDEAEKLYLDKLWLCLQVRTRRAPTHTDGARERSTRARDGMEARAARDRACPRAAR